MVNSSIFSFAKELGHKATDGSEWKCSNGFLHRFCKHYGILLKKLCGESLDCPDYSQFIEEVLKPLMEEYEPQNIYNADETSLFYKSLSNCTMSFDSEQVHDSKLHQSKDHIAKFFCLFLWLCINVLHDVGECCKSVPLDRTGSYISISINITKILACVVQVDAFIISL